MSQDKQAILFLASWYPTPHNKNHGIFIRNHALALSKYMHVIVVYAYSTSTAEDFKITKNKEGDFEEWILEYKKSSTPLISFFIKYFRFKKAYKLLLEELIKNNVAIKAIQLNVIFPTAIALPMFKKHYKVPYTIVEHWSGYLPEDDNYKSGIVKDATKKAVRSASKIYYVSEKQKQAMLGHGLKGNYELLYNVVDTKLFKENKNTKSQRPILLHVSSLVEREKNISGTLRVIQKLQKANYDFDLLIVGGNAETVSFYKNEAKKLELSATTFVGEKTPAEVAAFMQQAHALILFSNYEGMPVVVLEALASGLPVFASKVGQLPNMITTDLGRLVNVGDEKGLENTLKEFLDGKTKFAPEKMVSFISENASPEIVGKKLADFYNSACS
ncbi:MAG: glycosyltransferase [Bacteroidota bacterium]|nr:glycosyltransferase [Bacteroidota bacterium]